MVKVVSRTEAASHIHDGDTVAMSGLGMSCFPEEVAIGIQELAEAGKGPKGITVVHAAGVGRRGDEEMGLNHLTQPGLAKRYICGFTSASKHFGDLVTHNKIECWCFPQGVLAELFRDIAAKRPGLITRVGLGTFVDPRVEGGRMNAITKGTPIELMKIHDEEYLFYPSFPINVGIIRGTYADENGNVTLSQESVKTEVLPIAQAAHNCGGIVIAQVKEVVKAGTLDPNLVKVPGILVDYVVKTTDPKNHPQTENTLYNPAFSGQIKVPTDSLTPMELGPRKVVARRAAAELVPDAIINLGVGIPVEIGGIAAEERVSDLVHMTTESGGIGGVPAGDKNFGHSYNVEASLDQQAQFDFYDGGGLDMTCLGMAETDRFGNVNVSKYNGLANGPGGFINIAQTAKRLVFAGTFTAGGYRAKVGDGRLEITQEGRVDKFVEQVEQITYAGQMAEHFGQHVVWVTERAVLELRKGKVTVTEIAPGIDLEKDVLGHMAFKPEIADDLKIMDPGLFQEHWGGLRAAMEANAKKA
ncbi:acyl CoA:acetate/3-ketoacid CoA transferase [Neoactinobaculum massilliense]|uniref:acyl CoA:acetate/3-ketoacid CoA transferase n=1 Tax=Neoactinobaculum massilliense TaxID=2364794 RepID=UPI000F536845|nr:CoA-transferase [Neoactinobaculum massilliense]